jgi:hypothetical protein
VFTSVRMNINILKTRLVGLTLIQFCGGDCTSVAARDTDGVGGRGAGERNEA